MFNINDIILAQKRYPFNYIFKLPPPPHYLNHHSPPGSTLPQPSLTGSTLLNHHSQAPHYL
ncbi:MAG: hypothetical protein L0922_00225, partial [Candidatus Mariimomonas ferrooxydans]